MVAISSVARGTLATPVLIARADPATACVIITSRREGTTAFYRADRDDSAAAADLPNCC